MPINDEWWEEATRKSSETASSEDSAPDDFEVIDTQEPDDGQAPASITVSPTSSTNPARPRTLAAGYSRSRKVMSVIFRDGTWWNYYEVNALLWNNFKRAYSKGWFLYNNGFDHWGNMGPANVGSVLTQGEQSHLQAMARASQLRNQGLQRGMKSATMERLQRADARIKARNVRIPGSTRVSNPYAERGKKR